MNRSSVLGLFLALLVVATAAPAARGRETDVVRARNGDLLRGELKELGLGKLSFKTQYMGTVQIEWAKIESVTSEYSYLVELDDGAKHFGSLAEPLEPGTVRIASPLGDVELPMRTVVAITPIRKRFLTRLDANVSFGFSFTKSSEVAQLNFGGKVTYREEKWLTYLDASAIVTAQKTKENSERADVTYRYQRFLKGKSFASGFGSLQRNDELGVELRTTAGATAGFHPLRTNHNLLSIGAGLTVNREFRAGQSEPNFEGLLHGNYDLFRYESPKTDLSIDLFVLPSISDQGRYRTEFDTKARREIVKDFFLGLTYYHSFDNRPPGGTGPRTDFGVVTTITYSL